MTCSRRTYPCGLSHPGKTLMPATKKKATKKLVDDEEVPVAYAIAAKTTSKASPYAAPVSPARAKPAKSKAAVEPEPESERAPEPAAADEPHSAAASLAVVASSGRRPGGVPLGSDWFLRNGRGKMRKEKPKDGTETTTVESSEPAFYIATHEPPASEVSECVWRGSFQLDVSIRCVRQVADCLCARAGAACQSYRGHCAPTYSVDMHTHTRAQCARSLQISPQHATARTPHCIAWAVRAASAPHRTTQTVSRDLVRYAWAVRVTSRRS